MTSSTTAPLATVPLRLRPHNPPEPFVGRAAERARLHRILQRGPVGLVWGFSGVGKSSLVRAAIADDDVASPTPVARWLVVQAGARRCPVVLLLHALARIPGVRIDVDVALLPDAAAPAVDDDGLADVAVTALEECGLRVFIDDVVRVDDAPRLVALLDLARRFARRARVVVVSREDPRDPALLAQTVAVGPLPDDDIVALLREAQPSMAAAEAHAIARRARGSPWRALQLTLGDDTGDEHHDDGPERSLLSLSPAAQGLLRTLALVPAAIPRTTLARATRLPAADVLDSLARRGWLEVHADAVRLHSAARPVVTAVVHADADERRLRGQRLLAALVDDDGDDLDLVLSAVALVHEAGDAAALVRLLERHGDALRHAGHAPLLCNTVRRLGGRAPSAALAAWAAALAADVGDDALAGLDAAAAVPADAADARRPARLDWQRAAIDARALFDRGQTRDALALLRAHPPTTATVEDTDALLLRGALAVVAAELDEAEDAFTRAAQAPRARARRRARVGLLQTRLARGELGGLSDALAQSLLELRQAADDDDNDLVQDVAAIAAALESLRGRAGERGAPSPRRSPSSTTNALLIDAVTALSTGNARLALDAALKARGRLAQRGHALGALEAGVLAIDAAIAAADPDALQALAAAVRDESHAARSPRFALEARFAAAAIAAADRPPDAALLVELAQATSTSPVVARRARALLGEDVDLDDVDRIVLARVGAAARRQPPPTTTKTTTATTKTKTTTTTTTAPAAAAVARVVRLASGPEWTVEAAALRILLADGSAVDLSGKKVLFDLLCALCRRGGAATKEQLLQDAWGVRDYHPLHHDNRLKVAVRKLRRLLEDVLGADPVEAGDDGYRLRGRVRFIG